MKVYNNNKERRGEPVIGKKFVNKKKKQKTKLILTKNKIITLKQKDLIVTTQYMTSRKLE